MPPMRNPVALTCITYIVTMLCSYACMQSKQRGVVSQIKLPSEAYRAIGGNSHSIAVSRYSAPLMKTFRQPHPP